MNSFDEIMKYCPFLKEVIETKITEEVSKAKAEKDKELQELKQQNEGLQSAMAELSVMLTTPK